MKKWSFLTAMLLLAATSILAQNKEKEEVVVIKIKTNAVTNDTSINVEKVRLHDADIFISDSMLIAGKGKFIFIDREGRKKIIHPDSLDTISAEFIKQIKVEDKGEGKVVIIEEKDEGERITETLAGDDEDKIISLDILAEIFPGKDEMTKEDIEKLKETLAKYFDDVEIKETVDEDGEQVIQIRIVKD